MGDMAPRLRRRAFAGLILFAVGPLASAGMVLLVLSDPVPWIFGESAAPNPVRSAFLTGLVVGICGASGLFLAWPVFVHVRRQGRIVATVLRERSRWRRRERGRVREVYRRGVERLVEKVTHDLGNVLSGMLAAAETIDGLTVEPRVRRVTAGIVAGARQGLEFGHHLLSYAGEVPLIALPFELNALLREAQPGLLELTGAGNGLRVDLAPQRLPVRLDREQFVICLRELVANAVAATRDHAGLGRSGPRIVVRTRLITDMTSDPEGELCAAIEVEDVGHGMDPGGIERALEPFASTRPGSLGLGLPMVRSFAQRSGGRVEITSAPGIGTRVMLSLPLDAAHETGPADADTGPAQRISVQGARVLVVEDNAILRNGLARRLRTVGVEVLEAADAEEALTLLAERPDALMTDVVLPGDMDGVGLSRFARENDPDLAVIFVSRFISARQPALLAADERSNFMRKPIDFDNLVAVLNGLLSSRAKRLASRDVPPRQGSAHLDR